MPVCSADGKRFIFTNTTPHGIELWTGEVAAARLRKLDGLAVNPVYGSPVRWMPDNHTLLVRTVPAKRGAPPSAPNVPKAPTFRRALVSKPPSALFKTSCRTRTMQYERIYQALRGNGATVRYVTPPARIARLRRARVHRARPLREDELVRQAHEERPAPRRTGVGDEP